MAPRFHSHAKKNRISFRATSFDASSDVFSFGVLLFEIFVRERPWGVVDDNVAVAKKVAAGERLIVPRNVPETVRSLIVKCWLVLPTNRPTMAAVRDVSTIGQVIRNDNHTSSWRNGTTLPSIEASNSDRFSMESHSSKLNV